MALLAPPGYAYDLDLLHRAVSAALNTPNWGARYHGGYHIRLQRGPGQVLRLPSLKHITVYNPDNDLIWEYETDCTRSASSDMRTFSPAVRM